MPHAEGVIQFELRHSTAPARAFEGLAELVGWRELLRRAALLGQDPGRYDGFGFGNISRRIPPFHFPPRRRRFAISGTQTGQLATLDAEHFAVVTEHDPRGNRVVAEGPVEPSSESLTHAMLYQLDSTLRCVVHVHSPELWREAPELGLPVTDSDVGYGTPGMARQVEALYRGGAGLRRAGLFVMGGHEDGVVAFGRSVEEAGATLLLWLGRALARGSISR